MDDTVSTILHQQVTLYQTDALLYIARVLPIAFGIIVSVSLVFIAFKWFFILAFNGGGNKTVFSVPEIEAAEGWAPGAKAQFDGALLHHDKSTVEAMLPSVPLEYRARFQTEINNVTGSNGVPFDPPWHHTKGSVYGTGHI